MPSLNINIGQDVFKLVSREVGARSKYSLSDSIQTTARHGLKTLDIATCTGINLNTESGVNKLYHLAPEFQAHQSFNVLKKHFEEQVYKLQESFGKVRAFIYGGIEYDSKNPQSKESFNLYNNLTDIMELLNVEFSMLCGKKGVNFHDNMHVLGNKLTIWNDSFKKLGENPEKLDNAEKLEFLKDRYQFVESTGDDFFTIL